MRNRNYTTVVPVRTSNGGCLWGTLRFFIGGIITLFAAGFFIRCVLWTFLHFTAALPFVGSVFGVAIMMQVTKTFFLWAIGKGFHLPNFQQQPQQQQQYMEEDYED